MIEIKAYIRNVMVDNVIDALNTLEAVTGIAVVPLKEYGHSARDGSLERVEMTKLEVDVADDAAQQVVDCIVQHARTGKGHPGDGRIFVTELKQAVRIVDGSRE